MMLLVTKGGDLLGHFTAPAEVERNLIKLGRHEFEPSDPGTRLPGPSGLVPRSILYGMGRDRYTLVGMAAAEFAKIPGVVLSPKITRGDQADLRAKTRSSEQCVGDVEYKALKEAQHGFGPHGRAADALDGDTRD